MFLFAFLPSSSTSPMKARSVPPPPYRPTSIIVRLLLLAQNRCCKAHRVETVLPIMQPRNSSKNLPQPHSYMEDRNPSRASSLWTPFAGQHDSPRVTGLWVWDVPESGNPVPAPPVTAVWADGSLPLLGSLEWTSHLLCLQMLLLWAGFINSW